MMKKLLYGFLSIVTGIWASHILEGLCPNFELPFQQFCNYFGNFGNFLLNLLKFTSDNLHKLPEYPNLQECWGKGSFPALSHPPPGTPMAIVFTHTFLLYILSISYIWCCIYDVMTSLTTKPSSVFPENTGSGTFSLPFSLSSCTVDCCSTKSLSR